MSLDKDVLARIKKLQAKADSLKQMGPEYELEAMAFAAAVQTMLLKYDLEMSDVEYQLNVDADPVLMHEVNPADFGLTSKKREILWEQVLADVVAQAHQCEIIPVIKTNGFYLVGRRQHRQVAEYMYVYLNRAVVALADKAYNKRFYELRDLGLVTQARGYRASFIEGCVYRLVKRYDEAKAKAVDELSQQERKVAVVRLSNETQLVKSFMEDLAKAGVTKNRTSTPLSRKEVNVLGRNDGWDAGGTLDLQANSLGSKPPQPNQLGEGQRLIQAKH